MRHRPAVLAVALVVCASAACGKKGNPLPPLRPPPGRIADATAHRIDDRVELRFTVPAANADGTTPSTVERVEIYGMSAAASVTAPTPAQMIASKNLKRTIAVRRPPPEGKPVAPADEGKPLPGDPATYTEAVASGAHGTDAPVRYYLVVGVAGRDRRGAPSALLTVPLATEPPAPPGLSLTYDEHAFKLTWTAAATGLGFRVYDADQAGHPTGAPASGETPLQSPEFSTALTFGKPRCFVVRALAVTGPTFIEGAPSDPACETPVDTFPPSPPTELRAIPEEGGVTLSWNAVTADDLAGYIVLRGEGGGDRLLPLMSAPITATTFKDTTVVRGATYVYAVLAVDSSPRQNRSAESNRETVTIR